MMIMKKKLTIEELKEAYLEAEKTFKKLKEQFDEAKKEEEEAKKAKLRAEKEVRYKEIVEAYKKADDLRDAFIEDYGYFTFDDEGITFSLGDFFFKMR